MCVWVGGGPGGGGGGGGGIGDGEKEGNYIHSYTYCNNFEAFWWRGAGVQSNIVLQD